MFHPWRTLRAMADWTVRFEPLPAGLLGLTDHVSRTITLAPGMTQAQRRSTLAHELRHATRPPFFAAQHAVEEAIVQRQSGADLITLDRLVEALRWSLDEHELADELWVDVDTVRTRLAGLTVIEQNWIEKELDRDDI